MNTPAEKFDNLHRSVLLFESIEQLRVIDNGVFIDATLGLGGHSKAIFENAKNVRLLGIDQDSESLEYAKSRLSAYGDRFQLKKGNFSSIKEIAREANFENVDGIIADLGVSSIQLDSEERGFSFRFDAPLDMRMDADGDSETAAELLARLNEEQIANVLYEFGEERFSRRIARRIVERRKTGEPVATTKQLAEIVERSVPRKKGGTRKRIHPATKTFQALRIAVNGELEILEQFLIDSIDLLRKEGRLVIISFHSLEDRIVKQTFQKLTGRCLCPPRFPQCICRATKKIEIVTKKPLIPGELEQEENPRARSAKLRVAKKI